MKLIDLQYMMDGDQVLFLDGYDGYTTSALDELKVKNLEYSEYKDCNIDLIYGGPDRVICVRLEGNFQSKNRKK